ncbi:hypothetical protein Q31b_48150 [Novipirellula aureliae]|uniref:Uncharacterized protein n=1 Tax=Novipirellula aureliae TaxID=2527966 RepID=A0A5C6DKD3_9BACT|nr:hypothetical protein Q31b_48150 [Novipirellula aureliae]
METLFGILAMIILGVGIVGWVGRIGIGLLAATVG